MQDYVLWIFYFAYYWHESEGNASVQIKALTGPADNKSVIIGQKRIMKARRREVSGWEERG